MTSAAGQPRQPAGQPLSGHALPLREPARSGEQAESTARAPSAPVSVYAALGLARHDRAARAFREALRLDPGHARARAELREVELR